ncbi:MAG: hypothetical protein KJ614_06605 [Gammaproteobacteria bacterium]|nr:hypothetical protein [Gammaproteobacteria bacterium]MBU4019497.1 hypothetical protein [Gammaproteobacteria bacterium]MBU4079011.1 hypothetical protein [Gammaproteobacteria bacterium]
MHCIEGDALSRACVSQALVTGPEQGARRQANAGQQVRVNVANAKATSPVTNGWAMTWPCINN